MSKTTARGAPAVSKTVEWVAREMYESDMQKEYGAENYHPWESLLTFKPQQYEIREYRSRARAAIAAMREPTEAMVVAHIEECAGDADEAGPDHVRKAWRAMIDAALAD